MASKRTTKSNKRAEPKILYSDAHVMAVHKPAGYVIYKTNAQGKGQREERSLLDYLKHRFRDASNAPHPVHRLDKWTCGVVLFAKSPMVAAKLQMAFKSRKVKKSYLAVVMGQLAKSTTWTTKVEDSKGSKMLSAKSQVKLLLSEMHRSKVYENTPPEALDGIPRLSLIRVFPESGRFHQIRQQCAKAGHPIIGDPDYADSAAQKMAPQLALVSESIEFVHPINRRLMIIKTIPDERLKRWIEYQFPSVRI